MVMGEVPAEHASALRRDDKLCSANLCLCKHQNLHLCLYGKVISLASAVDLNLLPRRKQDEVM